MTVALSWETNYWVDLALGWIEEGYCMDSAISKLVKEVSQKDNFPQKTRHKAFSTYRNWERENYRYIDVLWESGSVKYPVRLVSELNEKRYEVRKLEFFGDNRVGFAFDGKSTEGTLLGEASVPSIENINLEDEFSGKEISKSEFERLWHEYVQIRT